MRRTRCAAFCSSLLRCLPGAVSRYHGGMAEPHDIPHVHPLVLFDAWLAEAQTSEPNDPNAAALATAAPDGEPSVRIVLAKRVGDRRFCFFTNAASQKGRELAANPRAALCFHWKTLRKQVRVSGPVTELEPPDVDTYFHNRSRASQIGAAVSRQSRPLESREALETAVRAYTGKHPNEIPRPEYWRGFHLQEERIEFWMDGANRLHDRFLFERAGEDWRCSRLYP
jgi:pyridoxamine 5'-phosphate oxidase